MRNFVSLVIKGILIDSLFLVVSVKECKSLISRQLQVLKKFKESHFLNKN